MNPYFTQSMLPSTYSVLGAVLRIEDTMRNPYAQGVHLVMGLTFLAQGSDDDVILYWVPIITCQVLYIIYLKSFQQFY